MVSCFRSKSYEFTTKGFTVDFLGISQVISIAFLTEINHLIYNANQMTGVYMSYNTGLKWINSYFVENMLLYQLAWLRGHLFSTYSKFSEKTTFLTP